MDLKAVYKGFAGATPDGKLPKLNAPGMDGLYDVTIESSENFVSFETGNGVSWKAICTLDSCDNGKFKPGTQCSLVIHGLSDPTEFKQQLAHGNQKAVMAAALTSKYEEDVNAYDASQPWEDLAAQCSPEGSTCLKDARIRVQVITETAKRSQKQFGRMTCTPLPKRGAKVA